MIGSSATHDELLNRIKTLADAIWERRCQAPDVDLWLANFDGRHCGTADSERLHALHLLASVSYFGLRELRVLLRSMFRDLYRYPLIQRIRDDLSGTNDFNVVADRFKEELDATRFLGVGSPAESGTHLLYYFRQENKLPKRLFAHQHNILTSAATDPDADFAHPELRRIVFLDDLCGSGEQAITYTKTVLRDLSEVAARRGRDLEFQYLVLFGTKDGLKRAESESGFHRVDAVLELDETDKAFSATSRVFRKAPADIDRSVSELMATRYGQELWPDWPLGYQDGQLLIAFHHNIPDNSLPVLWWDEGTPAWTPAFPRYPKYEW